MEDKKSKLSKVHYLPPPFKRISSNSINNWKEHKKNHYFQFQTYIFSENKIARYFVPIVRLIYDLLFFLFFEIEKKNSFSFSFFIIFMNSK